MARDLATQYDGVIPAGGFLIDVGYVDFSSGSQTEEAETVLTTLKSAYIGAQTKAAGNPIVTATTDGDISNGFLTFRREGTSINEDARFYYILFGD